jgi:hypothetical protein
MTARDSPRRQPTAAQRAVLFERFDRICGAAWIITARGGQERTQRHLISANEENENGTHIRGAVVSGPFHGRRIRLTRLNVADLRGALTDRDDVNAQRIELGIVGLAPSTNGDVECRTVAEGRQQFRSRELTEPTLQSVAIDCGVMMTRHDDPDARKTKRGSVDPDIEMHGPDSLPLSKDDLYVGPPRETMLPRETIAVLTRLRTCLAA